MTTRFRACALTSQSLVPTPASSYTQHLELRIQHCCARSFSHSAHHNTRLRVRMHQWLSGPGRVFRDPLPGSTNYMSAYDRNGKLRRLAQQEGDEGGKEKGDEQAPNATAQRKEDVLPREQRSDLRPFPLNADFFAQPVLDEVFRDHVYDCAKKGQSIVKISANLKLSLERVAAVVRLKEIERKWVEEDKPLAKVYSRAVLSMLQTSPLPSKDTKEMRIDPHESITDVPVHSATKRQIFQPVAESRHFTRSDAAAVFSPNLAPIDTRMPHQELVLAEKLRQQGRGNKEIADATTRFVEGQDRSRREARERKDLWEKNHTTMHEGRRYDFRVREMNVEDVGAKGRSEKGVGWRYGFPHEDRKRGQIKIPTEVLA